MEYRIADARDARALAALRWDFRTEDGVEAAMSRDAFVDACAAVLTEELASGQWAYWVADDAGELVAMIFVRRIRKVPKPLRLHDEFAYMTNVYARPAYRNRGVGSELMRHVIAWAREQDFENIIVWPSERAVSFYTHAGFAPDTEALNLQLRDYVG
jgi:GNAT superfamily N-acetyltransferase